MVLPELSVRRHVLAWMLSGVLVLFGIIAYQRVGVDRFPAIEFPMVSITTTMPGANPDVIDASVTSVVETTVNSVPGIEHVISQSSPGVSVVTLSFDLDKNVDVAFTEVQTKVNQILKQLPKEIDPPIVAKVQVGASPIMWLSLQGDRTLQQLNQYARNTIKKRLETIPGVGEIRIGGERKREIRVWLNLNRMAATGVTVQDVIGAFASEHVQFPGGFLVSKRTEYLINLDMEFHSPAALSGMIVTYRNGAPVRLKDIARVDDDLADYRQLAHFNGAPAVGIGIIKVPNSNTVAIVDLVTQRLDDEIRPSLPAGMRITVASNDADLIQELVASLKEHLASATLLAALVVLVFLKSLRSTIIIGLSIPVSLMAAVAVMYFFGFTLNMLTLLALLLLVGVVVDDAIVVLENIYRHREEDDTDPVRAAIDGSKQVTFAVLAATLTLVAIFAPVIFLGGIIGRFFQSFAVVVTFGVLASMFVALTLIPMLCSRHLSVTTRHGALYRFFDRIFTRLDAFYRRALGGALAHRWKVLGAALLVVLSSGYFFGATGKGFAPQEDEGRFMVIFKAPLGSSIDYTNERLAQVEHVLGQHKEIASYFTAIGLGAAGQVNQGMAFIRLKPRTERALKQQALMPMVQGELSGIPGVRAFAMPVPMIGGQRGEPLQFSVSGPNLDEVARLSNVMRQRLDDIAGMGRMDLDLQLDLPEVRMTLDRDRAKSLGISAVDAAMAMNTLAGGLDVAKYNDEPGDGQRYDIRVKTEEGALDSPQKLSRVYLRARNGEMVRLDTVAKFQTMQGPAVISRLDLQYSGTFYGNPTMPLGDAVTAIKGIGHDILPPGYKIQFLGQAEEFGKTAANISFAFILAMVLVYMVLASQFNSFTQPLVLMLAQPLAVIGGVVLLWATGNTLNIFSMIGLVLLVGLVAKNSILLVDFTNQLRAQGKGIDEALTEACPIRMRPVLMTSFTMIFAMLPAAIGVGAGSETNGPLAVAVIGGLISSTLLTLVVVPAAYSLLEHGMDRLHRRKTEAA